MNETEVYRTNIVLSLACFAVYYFFPGPYWLLAGVGLLLLTMLVYPLGRWIARAWMKVAEVVGAFNAKVILVLLFYVVFTPWSLFVRMIREDPMKRRDRPDRTSTFEDRNKTFSPEDFERIS